MEIRTETREDVLAALHAIERALARRIMVLSTVVVDPDGTVVDVIRQTVLMPEEKEQ